LELQQVELKRHVTLIAPTTFMRDWDPTHYADRLLALWQAEDRRVGRITIVSPPLVRDDKFDEVLRRRALDGEAEPAISEGTQLSAMARHTQRNRCGALAKFDWEALWFELIRIAQIDGFNSGRELRQRTLDWIATNWVDGGPSDSVLRDKLSRLTDILGLLAN
jgi:hypothetical protein